MLSCSMLHCENMSRKIHFGDGLEEQVALILDKKGIEYIHESENKSQGLDFYLPDLEIYIEVKRFYSERSLRQLALHDEVILIQGRKSVVILDHLLNSKSIKP